MHGQTVVGIDVGGKKKGYHAAALRNSTFETYCSPYPAAIVNWCIERQASVIAVDSPCGWSQSSSSRLAERELSGKKIHCFATPTLLVAQAHQKGFYEWVFNGEKLYLQLAQHYPLFDGRQQHGPICFETFPHAIVCALAGEVVPARPKTRRRREVLSQLRYDTSPLSNIDLIDAALCAVAAERFLSGRIMKFGTCEEGMIVVPGLDTAPI